MISPVELRRIFAEWRLRMQRAKDILQPPTWNETEWRKFSQALALLVRDHGRSWIIDPNVYWDLRWRLQDGAELVCQIEHIPGEKTSLVVAQNGGFATEVGSYTWLWAEFNMEGNFARDPYWVEGTWKEALTTLLMPLDRQASYLLAGRADTPDSLLLQEGARPNDQNYMALMPGMTKSPEQEWTELKHSDISVETHHTEMPADKPVETIARQPEPTPVVITEAKTPEPAVETAPVPIVESKEAYAPPTTIESNSFSTSEAKDEKSAEAPSPRVDSPAPFAIHWGMPLKLTWKDSDDIAYALIDAHPDQDPLKLSFPKLHKLVIELEDFGDDPDKSSESILESIQMAWYEEVK